MRGDMRRYATLITHSDDYTLMAPFGGAPTRGFDDSSERLAELARYFRAGTSELELVQSTSRVTWWFLRSSNGSMARSAGYRTRTGRCASPWSFAVKDPTGSWHTGTLIRSSTASAWTGGHDRSGLTHLGPMKHRHAGLAVFCRNHTERRVLDATARWMSEPWFPRARGRRRLSFTACAGAARLGGPGRGICERTARPDCPACRTREDDDDLAFCVAETNRYRARHGKPLLRRSVEVEAYAATGALRHGRAHAAQTLRRHARRQPRHAENECLSFHGWSLQFGGGSVRGTIIQCLRTFYDEGPGGGHHQNMMGEYRTLGCAVHVAGGGVSIVQDFGR